MPTKKLVAAIVRRAVVLRSALTDVLDCTLCAGEGIAPLNRRTGEIGAAAKGIAIHDVITCPCRYNARKALARPRPAARVHDGIGPVALVWRTGSDYFRI